MPKANTKQTRKADADRLRKEFGKRLSMSRSLMRQTAVEAAEHFGVAKDVWGSWESGRNWMNELVLMEFCRQWRCTADWLLLGRFDTLEAKVQATLIQRYPVETQQYVKELMGIDPDRAWLVLSGPENVPAPPDFPPMIDLVVKHSLPKRRPRGFKKTEAVTEADAETAEPPERPKSAPKKRTRAKASH